MERGSAIDKHGRMWKARVVSMAEAEEEDFRFWFESLPSGQPLRAQSQCSASLQTRRHNIPLTVTTKATPLPCLFLDIPGMFSYSSRRYSDIHY